MKKKIVNPFICQGYDGPDYFCDRIEETKTLSSTLYNGRNITLISPRRLGKTGLIWNTFHQIKTENKDAICIYIDIFPTKNQSELVRMLGTAVLNATLSKTRMLGRKILDRSFESEYFILRGNQSLPLAGEEYQCSDGYEIKHFFHSSLLFSLRHTLRLNPRIR